MTIIVRWIVTASRFDPAARQIIQLDGANIGTLGIAQREDCVFISEVGILPEFQGIGVGSALLGDALAEARRLGVPCELQVLKVNPARALYERLGFHVTGETETHFEMSTLAPESSETV